MAGKGPGVEAASAPVMDRQDLLKPDAIGIAQATVIGMATSAPAATVAISLAVIAATTAYGSGPILLIAAIPMLIIANAYRRLNLWSANCGASFEWVGRAINPYLGFLTGWLMIVTYIVGTVAGVIVLGPSVLAVTGAASAGTWASVGIAAAVILVMLVLAVVGIRISARAQIGMAVIEYVILIGIAIAGLVWVLSHHAGSYPITTGWFTFSGVGGHSDVMGGFLLVIFVYGGWDGTLYVNEEVEHRKVYPGRAAVIAVALLAVIYTLVQVGLQGVVSPAKLQANGGSALVYIAQVMGGTTLARFMALAIALSVIATTGAGIVLGARIVYGMASYRALPGFLAGVSRRYSTPVASSVVVGVLIAAISAVYLLATSVQSAFDNVIAILGAPARDPLHPHHAGRADVLPAPDHSLVAGRDCRGRPAARRGRLPWLHPVPDAFERLGRVEGAGLDTPRGHRLRSGDDAYRAIRAAVRLLPAAHRKARPGSKT